MGTNTTRPKTLLVEECADARAAALEVPDIERRIESLERVALRVVGEGLRVLTALLVRSAEGKVQLRLVGTLALVAREQPLHGGHLGIAESVVLEVSEAPVGLGEAGVQRQHRLVGCLAFGSLPQGLLHVADRQTQSRVRRRKLCCPLVRRECFVLPHQPGRHARDGDPGLGIFRLYLHYVARGGERFFEPSLRKQRLRESPPRERAVRGLPEGMTEQPLRVAGHVGGQRQRREPGECGHVSGVEGEDFAKDAFRLLAVVGDQRCGGFFGAGSVSIG